MAEGYYTIPENNLPGLPSGIPSGGGLVDTPKIQPSDPQGPSNFTFFDQYQDLIRQYPGFNLTRGAGGIQTEVRGTPVTQFGRPITEAPMFADVLSQLYNPVEDPDLSGAGQRLAGRDLFERGLGNLNMGGGISPEIQGVMDRIAQLRASAEGSAASRAQALATKRGIGGSSIEQFGVGSAVSEAGRPFLEQEANTLLAEAQRQQQLRDLSSRALFERGGLEATTSADLASSMAQLDLARRSQVASLTSDELASLRNLQEAGQNRALQEKLGILGVNAQYANISAQQDANKRANNPFNIILGGAGGAIGTGLGYGLGAGASPF